MRGLQRLANVTQSIFADMDAEAGAVADELTAAKAESATVVAGFKEVAGTIRASTKDARNILNQLTNGAADVGGATPLPTAPSLV